MSEPAMSSVLTSAHALHDVLKTVKEARAKTLAAAWSQVLDAKWKSLEFAKRHGEVVQLWYETVNQIDSLSPAKTRERLRSYASSWWLALIAPDSSWSNNTSPALVISETDLDHLANTGDLISGQLAGTAIAPSNSDLDALRAQCQQWISILSDQTEITEEQLRLALLGQMRHLLWLIENARTFGVSRVVELGDQVTGTLARTAYTRPSAIKKPDDFKRRIGRLAVTLAAVTGLLASAGTVTQVADQDLLSIERFTHDVEQVPHDITQGVKTPRPADVRPPGTHSPDNSGGLGRGGAP
jgi:hypothetical protein